jgi:hypothetical protein
MMFIRNGCFLINTISVQLPAVKYGKKIKVFVFLTILYLETLWFPKKYLDEERGKC